MTDPISPAEAAAAAAIDSVNAANASQTAAPAEANDDLLGADPTDEQVATATAHARQLEAQLAAIHAAKVAKQVAAGQGIPHTVPAAIVPKATDKPAVHVAVAPTPVANPTTVVPAVAPQGVVEKAVSHSAQLAQLQAEGKAAPKKKVYAYQRNRAKK